MELQIKLAEIEKQISDAHLKFAEDFSRPHLLAVSKMQTAEKIRELYRFGQRKFGENYVQEFLDKKRSLQDLEIEWHFIGHLQSKKAKDVVGNCELIHSIDSLKLIQKIQSICEASPQKKQKILLQVHLGEESTKSGLTAQEIEELPEIVWTHHSVHVVGLMTLPPLQNNSEENRKYFRQLRQIRDSINQKLPAEKRLVELSMGTSHDFLVAIEEGASFVRLGTVLFGERSSR